MKNQIKTRFAALKNRMVFRLWTFMMIPAMFGIGFMWVVQIFLFEQNYANASVNEVLNQLSPIMEDLRCRDIGEDEKFLSFISHINAGGELLLTSTDGTLVKMYSSGHLVQPQEWETKLKSPRLLSKNSGLEELIAGRPYKHIEKMHGQIIGYELGFPVTYHGERNYLILRNALMTRTVLNLNRSQLIVLSILLTGIASVLAAVLSKQFTRPIFQIKESVDKLTQNEFDIGPDLNRQDELGQLSQSVGKLGKALQRLDVLRREVIANVSHELKTPLTSISGFAELMKEGLVEADKMREFAGDIYKECGQLIALIDDIMKLSRLDEGSEELSAERVDLYDLSQKILQELTPVAAKRGISLHMEGGRQTIQGVWRILHEMIYNLCDNAIKYNKDGGAVTVRVTEEEDQVVVSVEDTGIGISEGQQDRVFERFYRVDKSHSRRVGGTGLGLSIVKHGAQYHNAQLSLDSEPGAGTTITLRFPKQSAA